MQSTYLYGYGTTDDEEEIYQPQSHILNARDSKLEVDTKKETPTLQGKLSEQAPEQNPIGIPISPEEWTYISRASAVAENPEEELNRYAAALTFSREYGIDVVSAMNNLDDLTLYQIGQKFTPTKTAAQAIFNSAAYGAMNTFKLNPLKEDFRAIDSAGGDTSQILDEIKVYESKLESLQDNTPRGWITELLKLSGQTASYSFQIAGEGIKFSAIAGISLAALAAASGLTVVTGGLAAPLTGAVAIGGGMAVAGAYGRYKKGSESAAAILYYELRKNGVDKDIANKAADIHGIISGAVESIFDQVGGALLPGIVGNTAAGAIANRVTSKIAVSGSLGTFVQSVTKYLSGAVGEGVEEFTQSLSESITSEVAYEMSGVIPPGRSMSIIEQAVTEAVQGFAVGMVLGGVEIPGMIKGAKVDVGKAASIRELAKNIPSKEFFVKAMETQKPEAATGRDWNDAMVKVWEKAQQSNKSSVLESDETAINELDTRGGGDPTGTVRRMETGELYTQERQKVKVVKAKNVITNPYDPHAEAERADMSRRATETPTEEVGNGINADTASVGDTITLYLPNGATEELTVTARSESGTLKVKNKKGEEHIVEDGSYSFKNPKDLDYEIDTIEGSPKISEMDDATIIQVKKRLKEKIEAQKKVGNTESALYFMRDLNALTFEQKRRDSAATTDTDGRELHTLNVGDPVTGNRYGFIDYTLNENTIEIEDVKVSPGYEGIRKEMVLDLINKHQGYDVSWDAKGENLQGIKDEIINENPRGADAGLQYYDGITNVDERVELEKEIGKVFPNMNSSEKALAATLLQLRAEAKGMTTRGYLNTYSGVGGLFQNAKEAGMELNPSQKGAISLKDTESGVKAVIYAGEKGDFSTFSHELFHLISKETGQRDQLREVFDEVSRTEEFEKFINTYRSMFSDEVFKGKSAKQIAKIMQDWSEDGTWTRSQDEVIARVWEAYLLNGETASPKLKSIFKRIADWMSKIYTMIKGRAKLDERIVKRFDELLENDKSPITNTQEITAAQTLNQVSAYHGSPHSFDKFATSAMGTGEGAQAFGWGLYFTEIEDIARHYAEMRRYDFETEDGTLFIDLMKTAAGKKVVVEMAYGGDDLTVDMVRSGLERDKMHIEHWISKRDNVENNQKALSGINEVLENLDKLVINRSTRNLYKVTLHEGKEPGDYEWLEWSKPPSKEIQDKVEAQLRKEFPGEDDEYYSSVVNDEAVDGLVAAMGITAKDRGEGLYDNLTNVFNSDKEASLFLLRAGIDGIRYPAQSMGRGDGSKGYNYVVFDENAVTIDEQIRFQVMEEAIADKGTTTDLREAGYVLPDGTMLDFSAKKYGNTPGERIEDHRDIDIPSLGDLDGTDLMIAFQKAGALRIDANTGLVDAEVMPTSKQLSIIDDIMAINGFVVVDLADGNRKTSFESEASPAKVKGAIRRFYNGGEIDQERIRFQVAPATDTPAFKDWFGDSKVVDENGEPLVVYHGTKRDFDTFQSAYPDGLIFFTKDSDFAATWPSGTGGFREASDEVKAASVEARAFERDLGNQLLTEDILEGIGTDEGNAVYDAVRADIRAQMKAKFGYESGFDIEAKADIRVMPVYLSIQNPFDPSKDWASIEPVLRGMTSMEGIIEAGHHRTGNWVVYENVEVINAIKDMGYDGVYLQESTGGPSDTIAVFEPTQIKSVNNRGTFDPNNPDIRLQTIFDNKSLDFYQGVEYVKHDEGYKYEEKDIREIDENVQEQFDLFDPEEIDPLSMSAARSRAGEVLPNQTSNVQSDWKHLKRIDYTGRSIRSSKELAELFSIYRNSSLEFFHIIYTDDNNKILAHNVMSSGIPGATIAAEGRTSQQSFYKVRSRMSRIGAAGYYLMHNHPTGNIEPSREDINLTRNYDKNVEGFKGHVILDHDRFTVLSATQDKENIAAEEILYSPHYVEAKKLLSEEKILSEDTLKKYVSKYMTDRDNSLYFIMNNRLMIIEARPVNEPSFISAYEAMRSVGGSSVILITPSETHFRSMLEDGKTMQNSKYGVFTEMLYVGENGHTDSFMSNVGANPYWQTYALNAERDKSTSNYVWEKPTYHITDKKKKQILSEAANEKMLFQTDITPDILESAKEFDSWEDFRAEYIVEAGFDFTVELPNDQWYKDVFNQAHGIVKEEARPDKVRLESEQQKDGYFADVIEDDDKLDEFMSELGYILTYTGNNENPSDQGELDDINRRLDLQNRIDTEVHPTIRSNAIRKNSGKEITDRSKQAIKTLIGGGSLRYYRDLYADVMNDTELKPEVIDSRLADIEDMIPDDFDTLSITNRIRLADTLVNKKLKEKILSGEETFDGEAEKVVRQMDKDIAKIEGQIEKAEAEISEKDAQLSDQDKKISALYNDLNQANNDIEKILKKVRSRSDADPKYLISEEDMKQRRTLSKKIENLDSQIKKYRTSEQVKATVKRHEALQKLKEKLDKKKVNRDEGVKTRALKIKYVRAIMIKPSKAVDVAYRKKIFAIQAQIDPAFRRSKIHLAREVGEDETLTLEETKIKLRGATEEELRGVLGDKAYERLSGLRKPLNDWTVEELRQIADEVYTLRSEGIDIWSAKEERLRMIAGGYQTALISKLISMKRYKPKKIPGTAESDKDRRSFKNGVLSAYYAVYNMVDKAMMLDGGTEGAMFNLLVRDKRRLQSSEWANKERRLAPIINIMKEVGINQVDWYKTAEIGIDGKKYNMTYSSLAYYFLSQFNEDNYQAIAYGTLLTQAEKKGLNFNDDEITEVGMRRYAQVIGQATEILTNTERGKKVYQVMEVIRDTLNNEEDKRRIQDVLIREYNDEMREVGDYLPIHRVGVTYDDLAQNVAADFYNMNAGGAATSVEQGFKTTRINISPAHQSAVNTDLFGVVYRSISEQEHMIAFAEYGRNLNRIFKNPGSKLTQEVITQTFGKAMLDDVHDYINEVINPDSFEQLKSVDKLLRAARGNLGAAYLGWKTSALVLQAITSPMPYLSEMSIPRLAKSYLHIAANNPLKVWDFIAGKSQMMKNRSANVVIDLILKQSKEYTSNKAARGLKKGQEIGTEGLVWVDRISVMGGWLGSYNKKLEELAKEGIPREIADKKAVEYADEVVLRVQPTGDKTELSPLFKAGGEAVKAFTQFQTALNVIFRNLTYEAPVMAKNAFNKELPNEVRKSEALRFLGTLSGYMFAGALLGAVMEGHDEDDETGDKVKNWLYWSTTQFTGSIPLIGDMIDANIEGMVKEETPYYFNDDMLPALNNILRGTGDLTQGKYEKAMRKIGKGIGLGLGLPVSGTKELEEVFTSEGLGAFIGRRDWK